MSFIGRVSVIQRSVEPEDTLCRTFIQRPEEPGREAVFLISRLS